MIITEFLWTGIIIQHETEKYGTLYVEDPTVTASWVETLNACGDHIRPSDGHDPDDENDEA